MIWIEWSAALVSLAGAWYVASQSDRRRARGFALFLTANIAWVAWGVVTGAWGLVVMQAAFTGTSLRGLFLARHARAPVPAG